ncbi:MAG: hypothetical protein WC466_02125 [Candidatus Izemoplasmatales bacterium]
MATSYTKTASLAAQSKGLTLDSVVKSVSLGSETPISTLKENPHPSANSVAAKIKLMTYAGGNVALPEIIVEQYFIKPNFTGLLKCSGVQNNIWYLPLNSTYSIKFYGPDQYNAEFYNYVYAVPSKISKQYWTGLQDFTTGVPQEWINAFVQYASALPVNTVPKTATSTPSKDASKTFSASEAMQKKQFQFSFWGSLSGVIGQSSTFAFEYVFYPGATPNKPIVTK